MEYDFDYKDEKEIEESIFKEKMEEQATKYKKIIRLVFGILAIVFSLIGFILSMVAVMTDIFELFIPGFVMIFCAILMLVFFLTLPAFQNKLKNMSIKEYEEKYIKGNVMYSNYGSFYLSPYVSAKIETLEKRIEYLEGEISKLKNERH